MHLKILLPFKVFADLKHVKRIVVETQGGAFGLLPRRLDCVAPLVPGILTYETESEGEVFLAVDEGVVVKVGSEVQVSVRRAIGGKDLGMLREAVEKEFLAYSKDEQEVHSVMAKLETGLLRRFANMQRD
ncbi:MAG: F0F1 ATP synthase subunit epsilon [Burkholderiales bacterium]|nr:F0F1 ATP synthase subunit epsilon [Burkholderiales bacterium]